MQSITNRLNTNIFILLLVLVAACFKPIKSHITTERKKVELKSRIYKLNMLMPKEFRSLIQRSQGKLKGPIHNDYLNYYEYLANSFPSMAKAQSMMAFCLYHRKKLDQALKGYIKASLIDKQFFWHYYNQGIIYYQMDKYKQAIHAFSIAIQQDPHVVFQAIKKEKVYLQMFRDIDEKDIEIQESIKNAYKKSMKLIALSYYYLNEMEELSNATHFYMNQYGKDDALILFLAGYAAQKQNNADLALVFFKRSLKINPKSNETLKHLSLLLKEDGKLSTKLMQKALTLQSLNVSIIPPKTDFYVQIF